MASGVASRVQVPHRAAAGETIRIRALIGHDMASGQRRDNEGKVIARSIINRFTCDFNGETVVDIMLEPAISTNPFFEFDAVVREAGEFRFTWYADDGSIHEDTRSILIG